MNVFFENKEGLTRERVLLHTNAHREGFVDCRGNESHVYFISQIKHVVFFFKCIDQSLCFDNLNCIDLIKCPIRRYTTGETT